MKQMKKYIFKINEKIRYERSQEGLIVLFIEHKRFSDRIAQMIFRVPKVSTVSLDTLGSCVFETLLITGDPNEIAQVLKNRFGTQVEPLMERLSQYLYILERNGIVSMKVVQN